MLKRSDEHWHEATGHPHWNESFYFNFFDSEKRWACATRVGATPNADEEDGFICLYLPDQTTGFVRTSQSLSNRTRIAAEQIEFRCRTPLEVWEIRYDGPIHHFAEVASDDNVRRTLSKDAPSKHLVLDLEFQAKHEPFDYDKRSVGMRPVGDVIRSLGSGNFFGKLRSTLRTVRTLPSMMEAHHYEQSGVIHGTVSIDGEAVSLEGLGQRDHSWGVRDMRAPANWRWMSCQFGDNLCFNATQVDVLGMRVQGGFVLHDGVVEVLESWHYDATHRSSRFWPDEVQLVLNAKSGQEFALSAEVVTPLPVVAETQDDPVLVTAARARYRWGERTADGMVEFMEQLE